MGKSKRPYFHNNWHLYKKAPDELFEPYTYEEVMNFKVCGWRLPDEICCVIRVSSIETGKVKEYVYRNLEFAKKRINKSRQDLDLEITVVDHESVTLLTPRPINDEDDEN